MTLEVVEEDLRHCGDGEVFVEVQLWVDTVPHNLALDQLWVLEKLKSGNSLHYHC